MKTTMLNTNKLICIMLSLSMFISQSLWAATISNNSTNSSQASNITTLTPTTTCEYYENEYSYINTVGHNVPYTVTSNSCQSPGGSPGATGIIVGSVAGAVLLLVSFSCSIFLCSCIVHTLNKRAKHRELNRNRIPGFSVPGERSLAIPSQSGFSDQFIDPLESPTEV